MYNFDVVHVVCAQVLQLSFASSLINVILHEMVPKEIGSWPNQGCLNFIRLNSLIKIDKTVT